MPDRPQADHQVFMAPAILVPARVRERSLGHPRCEDKFNIAASALSSEFALPFPENRCINYERK